MATVEFDEKLHKYTINGIEYPSVTRVIRFCAYDKIKNGVDEWAAKIARERGTEVHEATAFYDYSGEIPDDLSPDCVPYIVAYVQFKRDHDVKWELIEHIMGDDAFGFCGTADRIGYVDGNLCVLDIKTSAKVDVASLSAQLYAYRQLRMMELNSPAFGRNCKLYGLQLTKDGKYRLYECDGEIGHALLSACMTIHCEIMKMKRKRFALR